jgi:hypothetical protein
MISYAGSPDALRGPLSWHYRAILHLTRHDMILHDRGSPASLHRKRKFANLPGLILKIDVSLPIHLKSNVIRSPIPACMTPADGLVSYLRSPQKGNVMCMDCTTQALTVRRDLSRLWMSCCHSDLRN